VLRVVTLIPLRIGDDQRRQFLWDMTKPALRELGYPIFTADPGIDSWARAHAINNASELAGRWDIAIIGDADTIPESASIRRAIAWVADTKGVARPHDYRRNLTQQGTLEYLRRGRDGLTGAHFEKPWPGGGMLVVHRDAWTAIGGYDQRFLGWGHEDSAFNLSALRHSRFDRLPGDVLHLWHPQQIATSETTRLYRRMLKDYHPEIMAWAENKGIDEPWKLF